MDRGVVRQQQGLEEPDQDGEPVEHQEDAQEPGKVPGLVDQVAEREQPRAEEQLGRDPARLVDVDGQVRQPLQLCRRVGLHVAGRVSLQHRGYQRQHARALDGDTDSVEQEEEQRQVLVDRSQKNVETPGGHEEEEPCCQRDDKTQTERPLIRDDRLVDLRRCTQPDMPQHGGKHGSQDVCEVEAARDPGHLVQRQVISSRVHSLSPCCG